MHRLPLRSALALCVALAFPGASIATTSQPEVVVTASRTSTAIDETLASVSVITRADIEASATLDLLDLLRAIPGLDIVRGGGQGQQTSVFLRGANSNHVLLLIDGMRVAALGTGSFAWEQLALSQIERIEIVRGPRAALWGSDAIGGVVQIFTRRVDGFETALSVGNHDTYGAEAGAGWRGERGGVDVSLGMVDSGGTNSQNPEGFSFDPDDDGFIYRNALLHADVALGEQRLDAMALRRDNDIEFDQGESETRQSQYGIGLDGALATDWNHRVALAASRDTLITPSFFSRYDSRREQADWTHDHGVSADARLLFGLGYVRERGVNIDTFGGDPIYTARRNNRAAFVGWNQRLQAHRLEVSARHDDNSQFGGETTLSAAWGWQVTDGVRLSLSGGEGFRAPTLNELYSPGFGGLFAGNPLLDPERSRSWEAGLDFTPGGAWRGGLRAYRTTIDELIDFSGGDTFFAININRARIDGVEFDSEWTRDAWALSANATWQDPENRDTGTALLRRPDLKGTVALDWTGADGRRLGIEGHASSSRAEFGGDLGGYGLLSLRGQLPLNRRLRLEGRIENLLDREYTLVRGFNTPGMTALLTLRWTP
jgi:vitamin B12 transporter